MINYLEGNLSYYRVVTTLFIIIFYVQITSCKFGNFESNDTNGSNDVISLDNLVICQN